ncbi:MULTISPECIES: AAA family ATPase [unclassified Aureimonas]|uniref:AAA family ATPase n=1 Tax=unclassified Aureimonas TaxID=2615206 RepID=UPI0006FA4C37|nr:MULTISPECIES: AAA family ATPase [unclassified Aureimonas]KQT54000.1 hypothetical protein ASG62_12305 [Aureimonas sp. Leaf427]KQT71560.1 hypothetical protein ASG54_18855 [Aureimonas sp. Leaf460]
MRREGGEAVLLILSGRPGAGKTTLARRLAGELGATYLRIDTIEETIAAVGSGVGALGYTVAYAIARDNLDAGNTVIADCVNSIEITRIAWRAVAAAAGRNALEIEIVCSDPVEHRRRVEARLTGGKSRPTWADVVAREDERRTPPVPRVETAGRSEEDGLRDILALLAEHETEKAPPGEQTGPSRT